MILNFPFQILFCFESLISLSQLHNLLYSQMKIDFRFSSFRILRKEYTQYQ